MYASITSLGQDSHRFRTHEARGPLRLAGIDLDLGLELEGNSDADVVLHAICNAISGLMGEPVLGLKADEICAQGQRDSAVYLAYALERLRVLRPKLRLTHLSISIEALRPKLLEHFPAMRAAVAKQLNLDLNQVCITATTGEGMTGSGRGEGIAVLCILSAVDDLTLS
ncbi:MAG: 2-C-methyl-D-erythritol 2,4-cyclodiphosphate synthase [Eubacteriales bacterium]|nr:2-C-methyl-D-erythritol 2,4-cyclodiphosphate synthase [Eubacteriales bacterium]